MPPDTRADLRRRINALEAFRAEYVAYLSAAAGNGRAEELRAAVLAALPAAERALERTEYTRRVRVSSRGRSLCLAEAVFAHEREPEGWPPWKTVLALVDRSLWQLGEWERARSEAPWLVDVVDRVASDATLRVTVLGATAAFLVAIDQAVAW